MTCLESSSVCSRRNKIKISLHLGGSFKQTMKLPQVNAPWHCFLHIQSLPFNLLLRSLALSHLCPFRVLSALSHQADHEATSPWCKSLHIQSLPCYHTLSLLFNLLLLFPYTLSPLYNFIIDINLNTHSCWAVSSQGLHSDNSMKLPPPTPCYPSPTALAKQKHSITAQDQVVI